MSLKKNFSKNLNKIALTTIVLLLISGTFIWESIFTFQKVPLRIDFLDVGQGDATLITTEDNIQVLIDAGPGKKILSQLNKVMPLLDRSIDVVIITHPDKDHIEGLEFLLESYIIETVILGKVDSESTIYSNILTQLELKGISTLSLDETTDLKLGNVFIDIVWPRKDIDLFQLQEINNTSYSMVVSYRDFETLITGDLYAEYETELIDQINKYDEIEVYKAGHHGSRTSSSTRLLEKVNSKLSIISAGENNSYGHPHNEIISRFKDYGLDIFRTDTQGRISVSVSESSFSVKTEVSEAKEYLL